MRVDRLDMLAAFADEKRHVIVPMKNWSQCVMSQAARAGVFKGLTWGLDDETKDDGGYVKFKGKYGFSAIAELFELSGVEEAVRLVCAVDGDWSPTGYQLGDKFRGIARKERAEIETLARELKED